jgi:GNAT superfamily N-acetyltransferase
MSDPAASDAAPGALQVDPSPHESACFGARIVRIEVATPAEAAASAEACAAAGADLAVATSRADRPEVVAQLVQTGWELTDTLMRLEGPACPEPSLSPLKRRHATPADRDTIGAMAVSAFTNHFSHYAADDRLDASRIPYAYADWARRLCCEPDDTTTMLLYESGELVAFSACRLLSSGVGEVLLTAVGAGHRGQGIGRRVTADSAAWLGGEGVETVVAVAGVTNVRALRELIHAGLRPRHASYVFHQWFAGATGSPGLR